MNKEGKGVKPLRLSVKNEKKQIKERRKMEGSVKKERKKK